MAKLDESTVLPPKGEVAVTLDNPEIAKVMIQDLAHHVSNSKEDEEAAQEASSDNSQIQLSNGIQPPLTLQLKKSQENLFLLLLLGQLQVKLDKDGNLVLINSTGNNLPVRPGFFSELERLLTNQIAPTLQPTIEQGNQFYNSPASQALSPNFKPPYTVIEGGHPDLGTFATSVSEKGIGYKDTINFNIGEQTVNAELEVVEVDGAPRLRLSESEDKYIEIDSNGIVYGHDEQSNEKTCTISNVNNKNITTKSTVVNGEVVAAEIQIRNMTEAEIEAKEQRQAQAQASAEQGSGQEMIYKDNHGNIIMGANNSGGYTIKTDATSYEAAPSVNVENTNMQSQFNQTEGLSEAEPTSSFTMGGVDLNSYLTGLSASSEQLSNSLNRQAPSPH